MRQLGEALRLLRVFHDMSQTQLAERLDMSKSFVSEIESGKKEPTLQVLDRYADAFGVNVSSLLFFGENVGDVGARSARAKIAPKVIKLLKWLKDTDQGTGRKKPPQREEGVPAAQRVRA